MIQIKRNNKVFFTLEDFGEGSKLSYQLMDHHYIILKFTTATPIYFEIGDSVEIPDFGYFELTSSYFLSTMIVMAMTTKCRWMPTICLGRISFASIALSTE